MRRGTQREDREDSSPKWRKGEDQFLKEYMVQVQSLSHTWRYKQHSNHDLGFGELIKISYLNGTMYYKVGKTRSVPEEKS
jgi:hypothetical protein